MRLSRRTLLLGILAALLSHVAAAASGWQNIGTVTRVEAMPNGVELEAGQARVRVVAVGESVIRVRLAPDGNFPADLSWAVVPNSVPPPKVVVEDTPQFVEMSTARIRVRIQRSPLLISFLDPQGNVIQQDYPHRPMAWNQGHLRVWKMMPADEFYYGLGEKAGPLNRRNQAYTMWNTDAFGWQESTDPLYKSIPFFIGLRRGVAYGVFFDNTYRSSFDFGKESEAFYSFGAEGGELNYYFFYGPHPKQVLEDYTALVGRTPLPPFGRLGTSSAATAISPRRGYARLRACFARRKSPLMSSTSTSTTRMATARSPSTASTFPTSKA